MKNIIFLTFTIFTIFQSVAQGTFEGKIVLRSENGTTKETSDITWYMKNGQHLLSYVNSGTSASGNYSLLSKEGKLEMINERGRVSIPASGMKKPDYDFTVYKLLNKEGNKMLNEFLCIKYTIESGNNVAEVWMADDADLHIKDFPEVMQSSLLSVCDNLHQGGIPVQLIIKEKTGKLLFSQTISYIMPCAVADEKFK
ncbi:MAG: hypothetical protein POELPBGB_00157 [Bacteroidia bacterium]|nr:hypothetical protein [Bacteroidia bacterium]